MQCWLPASGRSVLWAVPIVLAILIVHAPRALSFQRAFEPVSTLDDYVPPQDLDLQRTVLDFVDSGILVGKKPALQFRAPLAAPQQKTAKRSQPAPPPTLPKKLAPQATPPVTAPAPAKKEQRAQTSEPAAKSSPFRKWVKPQVADSSDRRETTAPKTTAPTETAQPLVARRVKPARPLPKATAIASDRTAKSLTRAKRKLLEQSPELAQPPAPAVDDRPAPLLTTNLPPLTQSQQNLRKKVRSVLAHYYNRPLNTRDRSPWELMHAMLAFEADSKVLQGGPKGKPITAVGWLCFNQACKRRTLMYVNDDKELKVRVGPALQGHRGQLLAMLAQSRINENYPMLVEGHQLKIADLIEMEKETCYPRTELTFKLIGLMHYLDSDATWVNDQGMTWDIPKLIAEELRQPVRGAACGGTHRLSGLTLSYKTRERRGEPVEGQYLKAKQFVTRYQQYAYRLQNRDGSFSTEWFRGPGNEDSIDRKLKTTGHILEWLLYAASDQQLRHWRTTRAVNYLSNIMLRNRYKDWESGPLGHAIHALLVYDRLVFAPYDQEKQAPMAAQPTRKRR